MSRTLVRDRDRRTITAVDRARSGIGMPRAAGVVRTTACDRATRGRRAARGLRLQSSPSPSQAVASRGGRSVTRRNAGRARRRYRRSSGWPVRTSSTTPITSHSRPSHTSLATDSSPNRCGQSPIARSSTLIHPVPRSSIVRMAGALSHGDRLGKTPIADVEVPRGLLHWKAQMSGYEMRRRRRSRPLLGRALPVCAISSESNPGRNGTDHRARDDVIDSRPDMFPRSTCRIIGSTARRSRTGTSNDSWTTAVTDAGSSGANPSWTTAKPCRLRPRWRGFTMPRVGQVLPAGR